MMSSKRFGLFFSCFVICWILTILHAAWPFLIQTEAVNFFIVSLSQNKPSVVYNKNGTTTSLHPCNSCVNFHQYEAVIYPKLIPNTYLDMVIFIPSQQGDASFQRRQFFRKKMLNSSNFPQVKIRHVFVFGESSFFHFWLIYQLVLCHS